MLIFNTIFITTTYKGGLGCLDLESRLQISIESCNSSLRKLTFWNVGLVPNLLLLHLLQLEADGLECFLIDLYTS